MSVQPVEAFSPYSNVTSTFAGLPTWMNAYDAERIMAYQVYEQIYWNVPETFKLAMRGEENDSPIYVPTARTIVDTTNRFLCPKPGFLVDPDLGSPQEQEDCRRMFSSLFRRERFWSKFQANKLYGVMRGDWVWHVLGNPFKPAGRRIKIEPIDPAAYFPVTKDTDPDIIIAVHIVEQIRDAEDNVFIKRQTYQKGADPQNNDGSDTTIYNSIGYFMLDAWEALDAKAVQIIKPPTPLPPQIKAIPVYHIRNIETPGDPYGSSELRGFERIMAAINQAVSDEELALALEGLGMYETDGGPPRDEAGRVTDWILGPGRVVEHTHGSKFSRVSGVTSVAPVQDHLKFLINSIKEATGVSDATTGHIDVTVAESGIARLLNMAPMLSKVEVREENVTDVHANFMWDMRDWFAAYEQFETECIPLPIFGSAVPDDRAGKIKEVVEIVNAGLADTDWGRAELEKIGFDFGTGMAGKVLSEQQARAAATDPFGSRMESEVDQEEEGAV
jgi:hypothetical protein